MSVLALPSQPRLAAGRRAAPLIVEFVGLPGAGKTTVARHVIRRLRRDGYRCADRRLIGGEPLVRAAHYARFAARTVTAPGQLLAAIRCGLAVEPLTPDRVRHTLTLCAWGYRLDLAHRRDLDVILFDQGVLQTVWSVILDGDMPSVAALERALQTMALPTAYVHFDIDIDSAVSRIQQRPTGTSRFDHMTPDTAAAALAAHRSRFRDLIQLAIRLGGGARLDLPASRPPEELGQAIISFIRSLRTGRFVS